MTQIGGLETFALISQRPIYQLGLTWHAIRNVQEECAILCQLANPFPDTLPTPIAIALPKERIKNDFSFF